MYSRFPDVRGVGQPLVRVVLGDTRPAILVFLLAAALILLIACVNVATLLLVRGLVRAREIAVRAALGASRARLVRQLVLENALLAVAGGVLGLLLAAAAVRLFLAFAPTAVPRLDQVSVDAEALIACIAVTTLTTLLFGLAPALVTARTDPGVALGSGARQTVRRRSRVLARALVGTQVALATTILAAAGLLAESLLRMESVDLGFEDSHLLIAEPALRYDMYPDLPQQRAVLDRMMSAVRATPGVQAVSPVVAIPFSGAGGWDGPFTIEHQAPAQPKPLLNIEVVAPEYFTVLQMRTEEGRAFTPEDRVGAPSVVILNQSAARMMWPSGEVLGKRVVTGRHETATVIGVVPDARYRALREARPSIYFPLAQSKFPFVPMTLAIRTHGPPAAVIPALRRALGESAPGVGLQSADSFETLLGGELALPRLNALLLVMFAVAALLMAVVGLHGVVSAMVRQRRRELGIRLALGATAAALRTLVLREVFAVVSFGALAGFAGSLVLSRSLRALLFEASPSDPAVLSGIMGVLLLAALAGAFVPARRAARTDPAGVLRTD